MLDFNKPMQIRGSGEVVRYVGEVKRMGSGEFNHLFIKTSANGVEDILWRTVEGKHSPGNPEYDVINPPERREVYITLNKADIGRVNPNRVHNITAYGRTNQISHDNYETITLTYDGDKLVDVGFILS